MSFHERFLRTLQADYPGTGERADLRERVSPHLLCPSVLDLPSAWKDTAQRIATALFTLRQSERYRAYVADRLVVGGRPVFQDPGNFSALSCLDFHVAAEGTLKLIEYNTNASASLIADLLYKTHGLPNGYSSDFREVATETFAAELAAQNRDAVAASAIVDEKPETQRLHIEFLLYQELFARQGWTTRIADPAEFRFADGRLLLGDETISLVYNRHTDFYFESAAMRPIAEAFRSKAATVSPNPFEYMLLADKERMQDITPFVEDEGIELESRFGLVRKHSLEIARALLRTHGVSSFPTPDDAWAERKKYFFKPKRSFGGKAVYRGGTVSRTVFETQVLRNDYVAQEYAPAPTVTLAPAADQPGGEFKYDLRFFVYRDRIQLACARLYQGQATNSQTPGGGIAAIRWT